MMPRHNEHLESFKKLDKWIKESQWSGYDPYDIKSLSWVRSIARKANGNKFYEGVREMLYELFLLFPKTSRKLFAVKPSKNAKGIALICEAYLNLYRVFGSEEYLELSQKALNWLIENCSQQGDGIGWGYPFNWQSQALVPANTPNGIVTTAAAAAIWEWYKHTGNPDHLATCIKIAKFLASLPKYQRNHGEICFAYTPLFQNYVHNLNLFIAEFLMKVGFETENSQYLDLSKKALTYTLKDQHNSGAFDYEGPPTAPRFHFDHYHTGFVLRMLYNMWKITNQQQIKESLDRGYEYYLKNLFDGPIPIFKPNRKFPIDIHSIAEAVNCLSQLSPDYPRGLSKAISTLDYGIREFQDEEGFFYHTIFKSRLLLFTPRKSKIPHFRWGQAWMLNAYSHFFKATQAQN